MILKLVTRWSRAVVAMQQSTGWICVVLSILIFTTANTLYAQAEQQTPPAQTTQTTNGKTGRISGVVVDAKTGEKIPGVTIIVQPPNDALQAHVEATQQALIGAKTDLNGEYLVRAVPPGVYTITISMIGYAKEIISDVSISSEGNAKLDVSLKTETVKLKDDIKVTAKRDKGTTSASDVIRKTAAGAMDIVSADQISRAAASDAQSALSKVTGVSLMGDQAYVRGVSDRYLTVQLNGSTLPSSDLDKQSFRTDIVASNLLDNIAVQKTYTPDQPGNSTGAGINLATKSYPDHRTLTFTGGLGNNDKATHNEDFQTAGGSSTDKWGYDNGFRDMPSLVKDNIFKLPGQVPFYSADQAHLLEDVLHSLNTEVAPTTKKAPFNGNFGFSFGDNLLLFGRNLGVIASLSYDHKYSFYDDGLDQRYNADLTSGASASTISEGGTKRVSKEEVLLNGLGTVSYSPITNHDFTFSYIRNQDGTQKVESYDNYFDVAAISHPSFYRIKDISYVERSLESFQLKGAHKLLNSTKGGVRLDWQLSNATATEDRPDNRSFFDYANVVDNGNVDSLGNPVLDTTFVPQSGGSARHSYRLWRYIDETNHEGKADLSVPLASTAKFKTGLDVLKKDREQQEYILSLMNDGLNYTDKFGTRYYYTGDWESYLDSAGGIRDSNTTTGRYRLGPVYTNTTDKQNTYDGELRISSWYGMFDFAPLSNLRVITGARFEKTEMTITTKFDSTLVQRVGDTLPPQMYRTGQELAKMDLNDWLPSVNLVYALNERMNIRSAYSRTLARPSFREFSPAHGYNYVGGQEYFGNPNLKRTLINNFDLRWEWFTKPGEVLAISGFYKRFTNPIELSFLQINSSGEVLFPVNTTSGKLYGLEFEVRKGLGMFSKSLSSFFVGTNVTLNHSRTDLSTDEENQYKSWGLDPSRPMQGQPSYVVNADVTYSNAKSGTRVSAIYNIVGDQLFINTSGITPDVYEMHRSMFDMTLSQTIWAGLSFKCAAKNILDRDLTRYFKVPGGKPVEVSEGKYVTDGLALYEQYPLGRTFSASLSWQVW